MTARRACRGRPGFSVALIGCDGAGKTDGRARPRARDGAARPLPLHGRRRRVEQWPTAEHARRACHQAARRRDAAARAGRGRPGPPPHGVRRACRAGRSALRLANRLAEEWYRQLIAQVFLTRGSIVVFDRHFLADYHAFDVAGAGRPLSRRIHGWMLMHAYPRPDLVVLLDAPPEVLFARKGEGTLASLARRREDYLGLAAAPGIDRSFAVVSATQPVDAVVADVATIVREAATGR